MQRRNQNRTAIVIDGDVATYKAVARIGQRNGFAALYFPDSRDFIECLEKRSEPHLESPNLLCMVLGADSIVLDQDWHSHEQIRIIPKIYVGMPRTISTLMGAINSAGCEFIRKPFTLSKISESLENGFLRHDTLVREEAIYKDVAGLFSLLTSREHEVAELVGEGKANLEIAEALGITLKTVKAHRAKVMGKTRSVTIAEYVKKFGQYRDAIRKFEMQAREKPGS